MIDVVTTLPAALPPPSQLICSATCHSLESLIGNTPVLWMPDLCGTPGRGYWAKLEGHNPGGIRDRPGMYLIQQARRRGGLAPHAPVVESTSGTLGLGLALAGMICQHPVTLVTDPGMEPAMRNLLTAYGAHVDIVDRPHPAGLAAGPPGTRRPPARRTAGGVLPRPVPQPRQCRCRHRAASQPDVGHGADADRLVGMLLLLSVNDLPGDRARRRRSSRYAGAWRRRQGTS